MTGSGTLPDAPQAAAPGAPEGPSPGPLAPAAPAHSRRRLLLRLAQLALVAATIYFLVSYVARSWSSIRGYEWAFSPGWLVLSAVVFLAFYLSQAGAWWLLLRGCGAPSAFWPAASIWGKSILARYVPGNVFMFVGRAWMSHAQGLPVDRVGAAMVYEQALGLTSALVTAAALLPFSGYRPGYAALSLLALPLLVALMHPRVFGPLSRWALRLLRREPLDVTLGFGTVLGLLAYFVAGWLLAGAASWLLARAVIGLSADSLALVIIAYAFAYVVGMAAFVFPSGIGVREAVLTAALAGRLSDAVALAWALLLRLWVTVVELVFVGLVVGVEIVVRRRRAGS